MPQFGNYRVHLLDWSGNKVTQIYPATDFLKVDWEHVRNGPGAYRVDLVAETTTKDLFLKHYGVLIERNWGDDPNDWYEEYVGIHLGEHEWWVHGDVDEHYWASLGLSPEWLISQPLLEPLSTANPDYYRYDLWWKHGPSDDVVKAMVANSMVSATETARNFSQFAVQGNAGEGYSGCLEGAWVRLEDAVLDAIGEDGARGNCDFKVVRVTGGYEFRTYVPFYGTDRRKGYADTPTIFSEENGNVKNFDRKIIWAEEVTVSRGGWRGTGETERIITEENAAALDESPYSRREEYYNVKDLASEGSVADYLQQQLVNDGKQTFVTAEILQTDSCLYGRNWRQGDLVTLIFPDGTEYSMRVVEANGSLEPDKEEIIEGTIELWTR